MSAAEAEVTAVETPKQEKAPKSRSEPKQEELSKIQEHLKTQFPDSTIKFLWNVDDVYRFRINKYGESTIVASVFVHATFYEDGTVKTETKSESVGKRRSAWKG